MFQINFTNLSASADTQAYYEAEAARPEKNASIEAYYSHADQARWCTVNTSGLSSSALDAGDIARGLTGYGQSGEAIASNAGQVDRRAGTDVTVSAEKGLSALRRAAELAGDTDLVRELDTAFAETRAAMWAHAHELGLVVAREGKGGSASRPAAEFHVASITHDLSRAGDPQWHGHELLLNAGTRQDGAPATIDARALVSHKFYLEAVASAEMARRLRDLGIPVEEAGTPGRGDLRVAGVPDEVVAAWSKRRAALLAALVAERDEAADKSTKDKRNEMSAIAVKTRSRKNELPPPEQLEARHRQEIAEAGTTPEGLIRSVREAAGAPVERDPVQFAIERLFQENSVVTTRHVRTAIAESAAVLGWTPAEITAATQVALSGPLTHLGKSPTGEDVFTTEAAAAQERGMLHAAYEGHGAGTLREDAVIAAIADLASRADNPINLADEQRAALLHAASGNAVSVVRGVAGAGKTTAMEALTMAAQRQGMRVMAVAPTNRAASGLHEEAKTDSRTSIQGLRMAIEQGRDKITADTLLIIDEAGMADMRDAATVITHARKMGAQVLLLGDELQLSAIGAGAPLRLLKTQLGAAELRQIRRQKTEWQRAASTKMAQGDSLAGLRDYDAHGRVLIANNRAAGLDQIAGAYADHLKQAPAETRTVIAQGNADVHELNDRLRAAHAAAGLLTGPEFVIRTYHRGGKSGDLRDLHIRAGDALIAWRNHKDLGLHNGDRLTVTAVSAAAPDDENQDPVITLRFEKNGKSITVRPQDLVPPANENDPEGIEPAPYLQHAYAISIYASQGITVDKSWVYGGAGLDRATAYVAMTRHRLDSSIVFDGEAARQEIAERGDRPTRESVRDLLIERASKSTDKMCVADFVADPRAWAMEGSDQPATPPLSAPQPDSTRTERVLAAAAAEERHLTAEQLRNPAAAPPERPGEAARLAAAEARVAARSGPRRRVRREIPREHLVARAYDRHCGRLQRRIEAHNSLVARRMEEAVSAAVRPGVIARALWEVERTPQRIAHALREQAYSVVPFGADFAIQQNSAERREFYAARRRTFETAAEPKTARIRARYLAEMRTYEAPHPEQFAAAYRVARGWTSNTDAHDDRQKIGLHRGPSAEAPRGPDQPTQLGGRSAAVGADRADAGRDHGGSKVVRGDDAGRSESSSRTPSRAGKIETALRRGDGRVAENVRAAALAARLRTAPQPAPIPAWSVPTATPLETPHVDRSLIARAMTTRRTRRVIAALEPVIRGLVRGRENFRARLVMQTPCAPIPPWPAVSTPGPTLPVVDRVRIREAINARRRRRQSIDSAVATLSTTRQRLPRSPDKQILAFARSVAAVKKLPADRRAAAVSRVTARAAELWTDPATRAVLAGPGYETLARMAERAATPQNASHRSPGPSAPPSIRRRER